MLSIKIEKILESLNSMWWDKNISTEIKKHIGRALVETVLCCDCEVQPLNTENKRTAMVEMDYLRSERVSRLKRIRNKETMWRMDAGETVPQYSSLPTLFFTC